MIKVSVQSGTGIETQRTLYYDVSSGKLSRDYYHVISDTNDKLAYFDGETIVVSGIFGDEASEKIITMKNESSDVASPIESWCLYQDSIKLLD